jgi:glycerol-3-phosphate dehydrogenase
VDAVERLAGGTGTPRLQPTKGVHLVAPNRGLTSAFLLLHPRDGRVFFVIPWQRRTLLGTTDTFATDLPDGLTVTAAEEAYLLEGFDHHFNPPLQSADVLGRFVGLRPLLKGRPGEPTARSREFALWDGPAGMLSVAGGKYTTYRQMAEVITDVIARRLGNRRPCRTQRCPLDGTPVEPWDEFRRRELPVLLRRGLDMRTAEHLIERYGRRARDAAAVILRDVALAEPVIVGEPELQGEFVYQREHEMAITAADNLMRRTRLGLVRQVPSEPPTQAAHRPE